MKRTFDIRAWVEASRAAQGLPARIADAAGLSGVVTLLGGEGRASAPRSASAQARRRPGRNGKPVRTLPAT